MVQRAKQDSEAALGLSGKEDELVTMPSLTGHGERKTSVYTLDISASENS